MSSNSKGDYLPVPSPSYDVPIDRSGALYCSNNAALSTVACTLCRCRTLCYLFICIYAMSISCHDTSLIPFIVINATLFISGRGLNFFSRQKYRGSFETSFRHSIQSPTCKMRTQDVCLRELFCSRLNTLHDSSLGIDR